MGIGVCVCGVVDGKGRSMIGFQIVLLMNYLGLLPWHVPYPPRSTPVTRDMGDYCDAVENANQEFVRAVLCAEKGVGPRV